MKKPSLTALAGAATKEGFQVHTKPGFFSKDQFGWSEFYKIPRFSPMPFCAYLRADSAIQACPL
jgi:hypothetical protein